MRKFLFVTLLLLLATVTQAKNYDPQLRGDTLNLTLTIYYLYEANGAEAAEPYVNDTMREGQKYIVPSPILEGCHPDRDTVRGRMPDEDVIDTVYYIKESFKVSVLADPENGGVVSGDGLFEYKDEVTITAEPNEGYGFVNWTMEDEEVSTEMQYTFIITENVDLVAHFALLPPTIIDEIEAPKGICSGESLELTAPEVTFADETGWQMAAQNNFENSVAYEGQTLDISYNNWKLRYFATNAAGTVYSNVVTIKVYIVEPELTGTSNLCTMQTGTYTASNVGGAELTWEVTDEAATVTEVNKKITVKWVTPGEHKVSLYAENTETGCSGSVEMTVTVQSYVNASDVQTLVAKKNNGREYILIYPNPKDTYKYQWYKDGEPINGANGQYYYQAGGLAAGVYKLYISFNADAQGNLFGGAFTAEYIVNEPATISLCPNPAQANQGILIMNENGEEVTVSIFTMDGRLLHRQTVSGTQTLGINLSKGLYMVSFTDANMVETTQKLIIE